jgi:lipopolysaccharide/colanic/teichoic acid biosynthesis glycosyltransferase
VLPEEESVSQGSLSGTSDDVDALGLGQFVTRLFELVAGTAVLTLLAPVFLLASVAIKFDSRGPIFIRERRYGYKNRVIQVLKISIDDGVLRRRAKSPAIDSDWSIAEADGH